MANNITNKIMLVDDEVGVLKAISRGLKEVDAEILTASSGQDALELFKKHKGISLIISDQKMPEMTGVDLLKEIRDISPDTIRVLLTGYADIESAVEAINNGAIKYYMSKPWDDEILISRIKESLTLYRTRLENKRLNNLIKKQNAALKKLNNSLEEKVALQTKEIRKQHEELSKSFMETIRAFSSLIELRFHDVGNHSHRVAAMTKKLLDNIELDKKEYQDIIVAAFLHDIGKITVPDDIMKQAEHFLNPEEFDEIYKHPILGQSCLLAISGFEDIAHIIRHHHENFDGTGYPDNYKEDAIPFGSRVIRIMDAFDKEAFANGYPSSGNLKDATAHLIKLSGTCFDPNLVKMFMKQDVAGIFSEDDSEASYLVSPNELKIDMVVAEDIYSRSGMFLLPKGAKLSQGMIHRLNKINSADPIKKGVFVYREGSKEKEKHAEIADLIS